MSQVMLNNKKVISRDRKGTVLVQNPHKYVCLVYFNIGILCYLKILRIIVHPYSAKTLYQIMWYYHLHVCWMILVCQVDLILHHMKLHVLDGVIRGKVGRLVGQLCLLDLNNCRCNRYIAEKISMLLNEDTLENWSFICVLFLCLVLFVVFFFRRPLFCILDNHHFDNYWQKSVHSSALFTLCLS